MNRGPEVYRDRRGVGGCSDGCCTAVSIHSLMHMYNLGIIVMHILGGLAYLLTLGAHACSEGYGSCPVCVCVCVSVRSFLPPCTYRSRNIGMYVWVHRDKGKYRYVQYVWVHRDKGKTFIILIIAKNASFRSYGVICLPPMPPTTLRPQMTDTKGIK